MSKRDDKARERRRDALARSENNITERLLAMRSELDVLARIIDRATLARPPRMLASGLSAHASPSRGLTNLIAFRARKGIKL
jgi:hypothetical protein